AMASGMIAVTAPIQIVAGDLHGLNTLEHQPAKVMAMEGHFESYASGAPLILFGLPDQEAGEVHGAISIPKGSLLILKHDENALLEALYTVPRWEWLPVPLVFWSFRVMVAHGILMLGLGLLSVNALLSGKLYVPPGLLR